MIFGVLVEIEKAKYIDTVSEYVYNKYTDTVSVYLKTDEMLGKCLTYKDVETL